MDSSTLTAILDYLCEELGGDWFLTGGALVRLKFDATRGTEDMDLVRIRHESVLEETDRTQLFRWLIQRGLGPEWVNTAVEPFVKEVHHWEDQTVLVQTGKVGRIFRPSLTFFVYLKLRRGTPVDQEDIRKAIAACPEGFSEKLFLIWADHKLKDRFLNLRVALGL